MIANAVHLLFLCYTLLLCLRILSSWFPFHWQRHRFVHFLSFYTDPFLNIFRRILPPLGGTLDLSPIIAFLALRFMEAFLLGILR